MLEERAPGGHMLEERAPRGPYVRGKISWGGGGIC